MAVTVALAVLVSGTAVAAQGGGTAPQESPAPQESQLTFRAGVEVVTVAAAVRDRRGRVVRDLTRADFEVIDTGEPRQIRDFYAGESPISLAILLDISGSMAVGGNIDRARHAVAVVTAALNEFGTDEAALYTFDSKLREVVEFTTVLSRIRRTSLEGRPWGMTSLYDAIAATARTVAGRGNHHRAVLVITDGIDTGSRLTAAEVSGIASAIDVPVYLLTVVSPVDHAGSDMAVLASDARKTGTATLVDLARWTGGDMRIASAREHTVAAVEDVLAELRYQYLITFEPGARPGWHPIEVRTRDTDLIVHARSGYISGAGRFED